jgi:hypothetical protein
MDQSRELGYPNDTPLRTHLYDTSIISKIVQELAFNNLTKLLCPPYTVPSKKIDT